MENIKIFKDNKSNRYVFMMIRTESKSYKLSKSRINIFGEFVTHVEKDVDVLAVYDNLNNLVLGTWRVNGWKKAQKELEEHGYSFVKDMSSNLIHLTQNIQSKNLERFINNEKLEELKNNHDFLVGQKFSKGEKKEALYKIVEVKHNRVRLQHLNFRIPLRHKNGTKFFEEDIYAQKLVQLINSKHLVEIL